MIKRRILKREDEKYKVFNQYCKEVEGRVQEIFAPIINKNFDICITGIRKSNRRNLFSPYELIVYIGIYDYQINDILNAYPISQSVHLNLDLISKSIPYEIIELTPDGLLLSRENRKDGVILEKDIEKLIWLCQDIISSRSFKEYRITGRF